MNDLNEMKKENGPEPEGEGTTIEPLNDYTERRQYIRQLCFPAVWQGRDGPVPYGTPGWVFNSDSRQHPSFATHEAYPEQGFSFGFSGRDAKNIFLPEWGRSLLDMFTRDEGVSVSVVRPLAEWLSVASDNCPPSTVHQTPSTSNVPPEHWERCACPTCQRIQEAAQESVKREATKEQLTDEEWKEFWAQFPRDDKGNVILEGPWAVLYNQWLKTVTLPASAHPPSC